MSDFKRLKRAPWGCFRVETKVMIAPPGWRFQWYDRAESYAEMHICWLEDRIGIMVRE